MVGGKERDTGRDPAFASAFLINELKDGLGARLVHTTL
jgi:hypothetical protein